MPTGAATGTPLPVAEHTLPNGLRVVVSPDPVVPLVAVNLWYAVGSRHEGAGRTGLAHLFEHLMFEGSANVGPGEHAALVNQAGGRHNATTSFDRTNYFETVPARYLDLVLWLEADRMGSLLEAVTQESLDKQRGIVKNERRQRYDNVPYGIAHERLFASLYPAGHPYAHMPIGSMDDLDAASLDDVRTFFEQHYAPNNAVVSIVGDVDPDEVVGMVEHWFGGIPRNDDLASAPEVPGWATVEGNGELVEAAVPDEALFIGYALPPEHDAMVAGLEVGLTVLSTGRGSTFFREVVRPEIAAKCSGGLNRNVGVSTGVFVIVGKRGQSPERARAVVDRELARLAEHGPTEEELVRAKAQRRRFWLDRFADPAQRADDLSYSATVFGTAAHIYELLEEEMRVSVEDVRKAFALCFEHAKPAVVSFRPLGREGHE